MLSILRSKIGNALMSTPAFKFSQNFDPHLAAESLLKIPDHRKVVFHAALAETIQEVRALLKDALGMGRSRFGCRSYPTPRFLSDGRNSCRFMVLTFADAHDFAHQRAINAFERVYWEHGEESTPEERREIANLVLNFALYHPGIEPLWGRIHIEDYKRLKAPWRRPRGVRMRQSNAHKDAATTMVLGSMSCGKPSGAMLAEFARLAPGHTHSGPNPSDSNDADS